MTTFFGIVLIVLMLTVLLWMIYQSFTWDLSESEIKERLKDELIYDPSTGIKMTVEEAEKGHFIAHDNNMRIKSENEIVSFYDEEEHEIEFIKNHIITSNWNYLTPGDTFDEISESISNCPFVKFYKFFDLNWIVDLGESNYLVLVSIVVKGEVIVEDQLIVVKKLSNVFQSHFKGNLISNEYTCDISSNYLIIKSYKSASLQELKALEDQIRALDAE